MHYGLSDAHDTCIEMNYTIVFTGNNSKTFVLLFNFDVSSIRNLLNKLTVNIVTPDNSTYIISNATKKILNNTAIRFDLTINQTINQGDTLSVHTSVYSSNILTTTSFIKDNYTKLALPSLVCDTMCNPPMTQNISTAQAASNSASAVASALSAVMNGANLAAVWTVGSLMQLITLFCLINVPVLPPKLLDFYNGMGFANLNFLPNAVQIMNAYDTSYVNNDTNNLTDMAKYHASLSGKDFLFNVGNNFVMIIINVAIFGICVGFSKLKPSKFQRFFEKLRKGYIWNGFMRMAYMSVMDFGLAAFIQVKYTDLTLDSSFYRYFSTFWAFFTLLCVYATCPVIFIVLIKNKHRLSNDEFKDRYGCLYEEYREEGKAVYTIIIFLMRRIIALTGLVFFSFSSFAQSLIFFFSTLFNIGWSILILPYKKTLDNILMIAVDVIIIIGHLLYGQLLNSNLDDSSIQIYGDAIYYILMSSNWVLMGAMLITGLIQFIKWARNKCAQKKLKQKQKEVEMEIVQDVTEENIKVQNYINTEISANETKDELGKPNDHKYRKPANIYIHRKPVAKFVRTERLRSSDDS